MSPGSHRGSQGPAQVELGRGDAPRRPRVGRRRVADQTPHESARARPSREGGPPRPSRSASAVALASRPFARLAGRGGTASARTCHPDREAGRSAGSRRLQRFIEPEQRNRAAVADFAREPGTVVRPIVRGVDGGLNGHTDEGLYLRTCCVDGGGACRRQHEHVDVVGEVPGSAPDARTRRRPSSRHCRCELTGGAGPHRGSDLQLFEMVGALV